LKHYRIATIPGDGIGVGTTIEAVETLQAVCRAHRGIQLTL